MMDDPPTDHRPGDGCPDVDQFKITPLHEAYIEAAAALAEVRRLYFERIEYESAQLSRLTRMEQTVATIAQRLDALEGRVQNVVEQLSPDRSLYRRIIRLIRGH
jgi:hypothetical protein